jgi:hypothetical protein
MKLDIEELKKRLRTRSVLAVTVESGRLAMSVVRSDEADSRVTQTLSLPMSDEDVLRDPEKAGEKLALALTEAGVREKKCVVCVPPGWALTASTDLPEVAEEDLRGYLELRAEKEFTIPAGELRLGYCPYTLPNGQRRATLAAVPSKKLDAVEQMLTTARREAVSISLALDNVLARPQAMVHFLTNGNHTDVVVTAGGGVAGLRSLPGPKTNDDAVFDPVAFCRDVRITLGRLPEPVRQQVKQVEFGGPSARELCVATRADLLRMGLESPECADAAEMAGDPAGAAVETARRQLRREGVAFEFLVPVIKPWQAMLARVDTTRRKRILIGAACVILTPLIVLMIRSHIENHLQSQWNNMAATAGELDEMQQKIRKFHPWFDPSPEGLKLIESLDTAFPDQGTVWAKSVKVDEGYKVTCTGFARTQAGLMDLMNSMRKRPDITDLKLQQERGANPIQFSLTYQWEAQR